MKIKFIFNRQSVTKNTPKHKKNLRVIPEIKKKIPFFMVNSFHTCTFAR